MIEQISRHIWCARIWAIIPIRTWLVEDADGWTLVDAGLSFMAGGIRKFVQRSGRGPLRRIVLTHGHPDHVGAIEALRRTWDVPVYAHPAELPCMEGRKPYPGRKKARAAVRPGLVSPLPGDGGERLDAIGALQPCWTPGHSPGHVAYYHEEDRVLLAGDLFTAKKGRLRPPMAVFTSDMALATESARIVGLLAPDRLEVCHGSPVLQPATQLNDYFRRLPAL